MRFFVLSLGFALALGVASTASAQDAATSSIPDWAAPASPAASGTGVESMGGPPPNPPSAPAQVPLDGGLGLLALAGGAYAARKLRQRGTE